MRIRSKRFLVFAAIVGSCVGCDQATKQLAIEHLRGAPGFTYLGDVIRLQYAENTGVLLGLGGGLPASWRFALFVVANTTLLGFLAWGLGVQRTASRLQFAAIALLVAGGVGNLIDRVLQDGVVTDFLNVGIGPVRTGIFNVADVAITVATGLLLWSGWRMRDATAH